MTPGQRVTQSTGTGLQEQFAAAVRVLLTRRGLKQRDLANILEVSEAQVSRLIRGDYNPSLRNVERTFKALGCTVELVAKERSSFARVMNKLLIEARAEMDAIDPQEPLFPLPDMDYELREGGST